MPSFSSEFTKIKELFVQLEQKKITADSFLDEINKIFDHLKNEFQQSKSDTSMQTKKKR